ncbi:MAG: aldo/keto reductase [Candidatus Brocadiia bacterium]
MEYIKFGNTGMKVSRLCLGAMTFPETCDEKTSIGIIDKALDEGINFIDTANYYSDFESEKILGKALKGKRDQVIVATKLWVKIYDDPNGRGCSRVHMMRTLEDSLKRLQTDYIDLLQLHHPGRNTPLEEVLSTLDSFVKQGKVRYIGVANHYAWQVAHMLGVSALNGWEPVSSLQCRYNLTDRVVENEMLPFCRRFNIATMLYGPLDGGLLTGKYKRGEEPPAGSRAAELKGFRKLLTDELFDILDVLREVAEKYDAGMNQVAIKWLLSRPGVSCPILGGSKPEHYDSMYELDEIEIAPEDLERLTESSECRRYRPHMNQPVVSGYPLSKNRL